MGIDYMLLGDLQSYATSLVDKWKPLLKLDSWAIMVEVAAAPADRPDFMMSMLAITRRHTATMTINADWADSRRSCDYQTKFEESVIHELLHICEAECGLDEYREGATEQLSNKDAVYTAWVEGEERLISYLALRLFALHGDKEDLRNDK